MTPSWYDILDVDPGATTEEIRAAWRSGIDGLDPTDRRFAVRNQAAAVLLDDAKRTAYDAELAAQPEPETDDEPDEPTPPTRQRLIAGSPVVPSTRRSVSAGSTVPAPPSVVQEQGARRGVPGWLLVGLAIVMTLVAALGGYLYATSDSTTSVQDAGQAARDTAERAVVPVFSYDYRQLPQDQDAAEAYMTASFKDTFGQTFSVIEQNAPQLKAVLTASFVDSAVSLAQDDRVDVLVFFNQTIAKAGQSGAKTYRNYATLRMQKVDGDWLIDNVITQPVGS